MRRSFVLIMFSLIGMLVLSLPAFAGPATDLAVKKELEVRKVLALKTVKGTPAHQAKEDKLSETINALFDFEELGMRSLVFHWDDISAAQRTDFLATLKSLIEKNYLLRISDSTTYKIKWYEELPGEDFQTVRFKVKSGKYLGRIQLRFIEKAGKWVVFDMLIDDVSLMENYRSQFNKIIRKDGFDKMLEKMKRKLNELDLPSSGKIENDRFDDEPAAKPKAGK